MFTLKDMLLGFFSSNKVFLTVLNTVVESTSYLHFEFDTIEINNVLTEAS